MRKLRLDKGWSQLDLANACDLSEDHVSNIERGNGWVGKEVIELLADVLNVTQKSLFDYSENDRFIAEGGLTRRAPRKPAKLIVRQKKVSIRVPQKRTDGK